MTEILLGIVVFTAIVLILVLVILGARAALVPAGEVEILVNDARTISVRPGVRLLEALAGAGVFLASACGGKGTCAQCRVKVLEGGGAIAPAEASHITRREAAAGERLSCQVTVKRNLRVQVPDEAFGVRRWTCTVRSNRSVATYIKELVLDLPAGEVMEFRAGGYVQIECPPHRVRFADLDIGPEFRDDWEHHGLLRLESRVERPVTRVYSMANYPQETGVVMLNVRIATPPPGSPPDTPPGAMSTYLFSLRPGDPVSVFGPYGEFFARDTDREMVFVGGGAGMAPMRSHILDQLRRIGTRRPMTFWYGARSRRELFYEDLFDRLQAEHDNFRWHVALSEPEAGDDWNGPTGFIHSVLYEQHVRDHPAPEECEYYICGPPMMTAAVIGMLEDNGVEHDYILLDDFGA